MLTSDESAILHRMGYQVYLTCSSDLPR